MGLRPFETSPARVRGSRGTFLVRGQVACQAGRHRGWQVESCPARPVNSFRQRGPGEELPRKHRWEHCPERIWKNIRRCPGRPRRHVPDPVHHGSAGGRRQVGRQQRLSRRPRRPRASSPPAPRGGPRQGAPRDGQLGAGAFGPGSRVLPETVTRPATERAGTARPLHWAAWPLVSGRIRAPAFPRHRGLPSASAARRPWCLPALPSGPVRRTEAPSAAAAPDPQPGWRGPRGEARTAGGRRLARPFARLPIGLVLAAGIGCPPLPGIRPSAAGRSP